MIGVDNRQMAVAEEVFTKPANPKIIARITTVAVLVTIFS
jgi:hypothetical protein